MYIETVPNRGSRPAYLLRDARREGSKTVKRTLANLSHLPDHAIEALRLCLKGVRLCDASKTFAVKSTIPCGHVKAMRMAMARLGMAELVSSKPCSERDIVLAMIAQRKMAKHFVIKVQGGNFTFRRDEESIRSEERQDGLYIIRTSESAERLSAAEAVRAYKALGNVEKSFRTFNGVDILVRPIRHWTSDRVRAHIFLCMLTYYVEWHMRRALSTLLYAEDDLPSARAARDPVAKAGSTDEAKRKKRTRLSAGGFALRDWRGVMSALASQCRTTVKAGGIPVSMDTEPTAYQAEVFRLLSAKSPVWGGVPRNRNENWAGGNAPAPLK